MATLAELGVLLAQAQTMKRQALTALTAALASALAAPAPAAADPVPGSSLWLGESSAERCRVPGGVNGDVVALSLAPGGRWLYAALSGESPDPDA